MLIPYLTQGRTLAKKLCGIRIVSMFGERLTVLQLGKRTVCYIETAFMALGRITFGMDEHGRLTESTLAWLLRDIDKPTPWTQFKKDVLSVPSH